MPIAISQVGVPAAAMFFAGGVAAYCLAPGDRPRGEGPRGDGAWRSTMLVGNQPPVDSVKEQVQELLAQGGCPGWIALAKDPHALDGAVTPAAALDDEPPLVATVALPAGAEAPQRLVQLPAVNDELISEQEDLLSTSPEVVGSGATAATVAPASEPAPPRSNPSPLTRRASALPRTS